MSLQPASLKLETAACVWQALYLHQVNNPQEPCCRQNYFGEGSMACIMGLMMGTILLASQELLGKATLHSMLTFNPGNFFT